MQNFTNCDSCLHKEVCKHKDEAEKVIKSMALRVEAPLRLTLNCDRYSHSFKIIGGRQ